MFDKLQIEFKGQLQLEFVHMFIYSVILFYLRDAKINNCPEIFSLEKVIKIKIYIIWLILIKADFFVCLVASSQVTKSCDFVRQTNIYKIQWHVHVNVLSTAEITV